MAEIELEDSLLETDQQNFYLIVFIKLIWQIKNFSIGLNDGLELNNIFITAALKCVPPFDKPNAIELKTCFKFLKEEFKYLKRIKIVLALGKIAFDTCVNFFELNKSVTKFIHGNIYKINKNQRIIACYHPSPRNVNTGRINEEKNGGSFKKLT